MDEFEKLLAEVSSGMERFVRYRLPSQTDADDVLQEVYLSISNPETERRYYYAKTA